MSRHTLAGRAVWITACLILPTGCAALDALSPTGVAANIAWVYVGDTCIVVAQRAPFQITLLVNGVPLAQQRLRVTSSDVNILDVTPLADSLIGVGVGTADLSVQLVHSTIGSDAPDTVLVVRVRGGGGGGTCGAP